jgi:hypothetical protein
MGTVAPRDIDGTSRAVMVRSPGLTTQEVEPTWSEIPRARVPVRRSPENWPFSGSRKRIPPSVGKETTPRAAPATSKPPGGALRTAMVRRTPSTASIWLVMVVTKILPWAEKRY